MPNNDNVGQQLQSYLPGMTPSPAKPKKPHEMSPEEFAAHPYAVFHSTHRSQGEVDAGNNRPYGGDIHVGTEQAALERHVATSDTENVNRHTIGDPRRTSDARLHTFWHKPTEEQLSNRLTDWGANHKDPGTGPAYYTNEVEDKMSTSLVTDKPESLMPQDAYVRAAIMAKKGHEVHPKTMEMYRQGALGKGAWLPRSTSLAHTTPRAESSHTREDYASRPEPLNVGNVSYNEQDAFHGAAEGNWHGNHYTDAIEPRPRVSNNGPDIERMKAQLEQDGSPRA